MPEELCAHCHEFGVEGHVSPRLKLHKVAVLRLDNAIPTFDGQQISLHTRCVVDWLNLHTDCALTSVDAAL
jgi:hypothetical protein